MKRKDKSQLKSEHSTPKLPEKQPPDDSYPRSAYPVQEGSTPQETHANIAKLIASPEFAATRAMVAAEGKKAINAGVDIPSLMSELKAQARAIAGGEMGRAEEMLASQAIALQTLFTKLSERSLASDRMSQMEIWLKLALKAQSQCRTTLEALSAIKNPPLVFAKQANISHGHQQVNNMAESSQSRTEKSIPVKQTLGDQDG